MVTDRRQPAEPDLRSASASILAEEEALREGGGPEAIARQHAKGRMTARERIGALIDPGSAFLEIGLWAAYGMYEEWGRHLRPGSSRGSASSRAAGR